MNKKIFKKHRKGNIKGLEYKSNKVIFCEYGIKAIQKGIINPKQIEATRKILTKYTNKKHKIICRIYPNINKTKKPIETRMGNGKGDIYISISKIKPGKIIYEIDCNNIKEARYIIKKAQKKLPFKTILTQRNETKNL